MGLSDGGALALLGKIADIIGTVSTQHGTNFSIAKMASLREEIGCKFASL
jgi:hypothetical protein